MVSLTEDLRERFAALFPTWPTVLATVLAALILLFVLTLLLYNPVRKMYQSRQQYIQNNINEAERLSLEARQTREQANQEIVAAHLQASEIVAAARLVAQETRLQKINEANVEVAHMLSEAQRDIEAQQQKFEVDARASLVEVALAAAGKVVEHSVDSATNRQFINEYLKKDQRER